MADQRVPPEELEKLQQRVNGLPAVQAIVRDASLDPRAKMYRLQGLLSSLGMPKSYYIQTDGTVKFNDGVDWKTWSMIAAAVATAGTAAYMGAFGAPGSAASGGVTAGGGGTAGVGAGVAAGGAASAIPTIPSNPFGTNDSNYDWKPPDLGSGNAPNIGDLVWDAATQSWVKKAANAVGDVAKDAAGGVPDWLGPVMASLAGLPALMAPKGPSDEERAYQEQATRMLKQQEQRTQFQNPLYEAITRMTYGLQPRMGTNGEPYRYNTLDDVKIP